MPEPTPPATQNRRAYVGLSAAVFIATVVGMSLIPKDVRSEWSPILLMTGLGLMKLLNTTQNADTDRKVERDVQQTETVVHQLNGGFEARVEKSVMRVLVTTGLIPAPPPAEPADKPKP